jgi:hypothetical protein
MPNERTSKGGAKANNQFLTQLDLENALAKLRIDIRVDLNDVILNALKPLTLRINKLENDNELLRKAITNQSLTTERSEISARSCNIIIRGMTEEQDETIDQKCKGILKLLLDKDVTDFKATRLGKVNSSRTQPRQVKVILASKDIRDKTLANGKKLRQSPAYADVFVNGDEPPLSRKENHRLRLKAKELREHSTESVYIKRGQLFCGSTVVDTFDLGNQLFEGSD